MTVKKKHYPLTKVLVTYMVEKLGGIEAVMEQYAEDKPPPWTDLDDLDLLVFECMNQRKGDKFDYCSLRRKFPQVKGKGNLKFALQRLHRKGKIQLLTTGLGRREFDTYIIPKDQYPLVSCDDCAAYIRRHHKPYRSYNSRPAPPLLVRCPLTGACLDLAVAEKHRCVLYEA